MNQPRCRLVSDRNIIELLVSASIRKDDFPSVIVPLSVELRKVFERDAETALDSDDDKEELEALIACKNCSAPKSADENTFCMDGEEFEVAMRRKTGENQCKAADFVMFEVGEGHRLIAHMAEAKLGEKRKAKPNFPKCKEMQDKFEALALRLKGLASIGEQLFFIVPKSSFEGQRRRTRHWNEANAFSPRKLICLCTRAFLDHFSVPCAKTPSCEVPLSDLR